MEKTPKQTEAIELISSCRASMLYGGARSGKTFLLVYALIVRALKEKESRHLVLRATFTALRRTIIDDTFPAVIRICFPHLVGKIAWNRTSWVCKLPNNSEIWWLGLDNANVDKVLGAEYSTIYYNEVSEIAWRLVMVTMSRIAQKNGLIKRLWFDCNPPSKSHWTYSQFILRRGPVTKKPVKDSDWKCMRMNPGDNVDNLDPEFMEVLGEMDPSEQVRFLEGKFLDDSSDALWRRAWIENYRSWNTVDKDSVKPWVPEDLLYVGVAIDPAITADKSSNETGIIVGGVTEDGHFYVWEDHSGTYTPNDWGMEAIGAYHGNKASFIIAERNQGGDMVANTIMMLDATVNIEEVVATRGKMTRAEPVAALYQRGIVHHCGVLKELEDQLIEWIPGESPSPDRLDALVWLITCLMQLVAPSYMPGFGGQALPGEDPEDAITKEDNAEEGDPDTPAEWTIKEQMENEELWTA